MECVHSRDQRPYWSFETKGRFCIKIEFNSQKIGLPPPTWPLFLCFAPPTWLPWCHVNTLYSPFYNCMLSDLAHECFRSCDKQLYWFTERKGKICRKILFNSQKESFTPQTWPPFLCFPPPTVTSRENTLYWPHCFSLVALYKRKTEVCIKTRSPPPSLQFKDRATQHTTVKRTIRKSHNYSLYFYFIYFLSS